MKKKVKENVGILDAFMRITLGYTLLSMGQKKDSGWMTVLGSLKIAEGITRFLPSFTSLWAETRLRVPLQRYYGRYRKGYGRLKGHLHGSAAVEMSLLWRKAVVVWIIPFSFPNAVHQLIS
ncbi:MAG: DUF2892 domain-containing protein [Clostridia bacterium]